MNDSKPGSTADQPVGFKTVLKGELDLIAGRRRGGDLVCGPCPCAGGKPGEDGEFQRARQMNLVALAFSGGGIRSAAFNLGFLQGLANRKVLHGFDYLSTVSGGGYVGGWLSALLKRKSNGNPVNEERVRQLQAEYLATPPAGGKTMADSGFPVPESKPVRFLRRYADYLDPRLGLSGDTLALISLAVRNVVVMQLLLVSMLVAVFSMLLLLGSGEWVSSHSMFATADAVLQPIYSLGRADYTAPGRWLVFPAMALLLLALVTALLSQTARKDPPKDGDISRLRRQLDTHVPVFFRTSPNMVVSAGVLLPAIASGVLMGLALESAAKNFDPMQRGYWVFFPVLGYCVAWAGNLLQERRKLPRASIGILGGAATLGLFLCLGVKPISDLLETAPFGHVVAFAPPIAVALQSLVITVHLALAGSTISEQNREWWARAGGQGMFLALAWTLASCFVLYVPPLMQYGMEWSFAGGGLWAALTWVGTRLARGADTGSKGGVLWKEMAAKLAPWLFLTGMLGLVAWAFAGALPWVKFDGCCTLAAMVDGYQHSLIDVNIGALWTIFGSSTALFVLLLRLVDLNIFSAHSFYRNRLARAFLGASRKKRSPNPFTGFDPDDDLKLASIAGQRPVHLLNATLNLTVGEDLAWQTRRGASFAFTPCYAGYSICTSAGTQVSGYRPSAQYAGGLSLATAVATSGAAASPNMGFHTSMSVAALLTAFNMRLARWCPNPAEDIAQSQWRRASPRWSAGPLFAELFGEANGRNPWVNLSDGGHFDNLGIYELARRRAALIVVTDVGADGLYQFDDLAMVVRKLSVDFGVELQIAETALDRIRPPCTKPGADPDKSSCFSAQHWAFGRIRYPDGSEPGYLVYVKSSLTEDAAVDIRQYRDAHPAFPHESTADQWFDEDQFEAYRHLGQCIAEQLFDCLLEDQAEDQTENATASELFGVLYAKAKQAFEGSGKPRDPCPPARPKNDPQGDQP